MFPLIDNNFPNFGFSQRPNRRFINFGAQNSDAFLHNWIAFECIDHRKTGRALLGLIKEQHAGRPLLHLAVVNVHLEGMPLQGRQRLLKLIATVGAEQRPHLRPQQRVIIGEIQDLGALGKLQRQPRKR